MNLPKKDKKKGAPIYFSTTTDGKTFKPMETKWIQSNFTEKHQVTIPGDIEITHVREDSSVNRRLQEEIRRLIEGDEVYQYWK